MSNKLKITPLTANLYIPQKGESNAKELYAARAEF